MDPTLTRAAAHKAFGDLYRKPRPPELQEQVEKVIQSVSDVFARIQRIEEIDAAHSRKQKGVETAERRRPSSQAGSGGGAGTGTGARSPAQKPRERKPGLLDAILGGGEIGVWGKETETLSTGFLGRNLHISKKSEDIFSALAEDIIVATIKCFRTAARDGWMHWEPPIYNVIVTAYQFFNEYITVGPVFRRIERQELLAGETSKMQKLYAALIQYPNYKKALTESFVKFINESKELAGYTETIKMTMGFLTSLDAKHPTLKNTILAFHALAKKRVATWQEITDEMGVGKPVLKRYRAPESVMQQIDAAIKKHYTQIAMRKAEIREIENLRRSFFEYDGAGKVKTDFLNPIVTEVLRRIYNEKLVNDMTVKSHKTEPPKLLFVIMKDFDISSLYLLEGSFHVRDGGNQIEVILFKQGLFRVVIDEFNGLLREIEMFFKKNKNMAFHFQNLTEILKKDSGDEEMRRFVALSRRANKFFKTISVTFRTIWDNHLGAKSDTNQAVQEKLARTKTIPIESLAVGKRYIPFYEMEVVSNNRWNGLSVEKVIEQIVRNMYNYMFIFRDEELLTHLSSTTRLQAEIQSLIEELKKLGVDYEDSAPP